MSWVVLFFPRGNPADTTQKWDMNKYITTCKTDTTSWHICIVIFSMEYIKV